MGIYLDPDNLRFRQMLDQRYFVDKTGILERTNEVICTPMKFLCVSRPRRFGKTFAAEILSSYYSCGCDSTILFQDMKIASSPDYEKHLNQYHVIKLDIQGLSVKLESEQKEQERGRQNGRTSGKKKGGLQTDFSGMDVIDYICYVVKNEMKIVFPGCSDWNGGLARTLLDVYMNAAGNPKFVFVIDEWDYLYRKKDDSAIQEKYISFLVDLFKDDAMQWCIALAYMTGIYPIKKYGIQSELNNFVEYTMIEPLNMGEYMGFTEAEVKDLCLEAGIPFEEIKNWYDGYFFTDVGSVYNPRSVIMAATFKRCSSYWSKTESYEVLRRLINQDLKGLQQTIALLLNGFSISIRTGSFSNNIGRPQSLDELLTQLVHLGYLACKNISGKIFYVFIPNYEIQSEFEDSTSSSEWMDVFESLADSEGLLQDTWSGKQEDVAKAVDKIHLDYTSSFDYNDENALSGVLMLAYYTARNQYEIIKEENTGRGRADLFFRPKPDSFAIPMIIELKWNKTAHSAIRQAKQKRYFQKLSKYPEVLLVGISYNPDSGEHSCLIERWKQ